MRGGIAQLRKQGAVLLADLRAKEAGEILCVYEKDAQFLEFLEGLHLRPSTTVEVLKREYDETMTLRSNGKTMHLGKPATSRIWVRRGTPQFSHRKTFLATHYAPFFVFLFPAPPP